jgi:hypothetical protein
MPKNWYQEEEQKTKLEEYQKNKDKYRTVSEEQGQVPHSSRRKRVTSFKHRPPGCLFPTTLLQAVDTRVMMIFLFH